jgi:DNA-binding IclR family transcriptional regulator
MRLEPYLLEVVDFVKWYKQRFVPASPSLADIAENFHVSRQTAANWVNRLVEKKALERGEDGRLIIPGEKYTVKLP